MKNHNKLTAVILTGIFLSSCSSSSSSNNNQGGNNGNNGDASTLQVITPKIIYSKTTTSHGYIVVNNPGDQTISNLHYTLSNQYGSGSTAIINEASANSCAIIPAHSQCNVEISVPAGAIAGSLGFSAENTSSSSSSTNKASQASNRTPIMQVGIEQAYYNSITGADGITLSYYHTVIAGVPYILVTGIVASNKAGSFNNIVLVDSHDNAIPNQQLISGSINSAQGSTFSILLPVSASSSISQTIKVQTQQITDGKVTAHATATAGSTLVTTSGVGIADLLPGAVYLTSNHPEQVITFANTGDAVAQLQKLAASNSNIEVIFTPSNLNSGAITTATLKLKNPAVPATSGSVTLNYNNSKEDTKSSAVTEQNITPQPTPTPTPSPTPTPAPPPGPTAGLTLIFNPDNNFFTTTAIHTVSRQLTIRNSGNTAENNFQITLPPANFSISNGISDTCTISGSTLTNSLTPNQACTVTVTYNNSTATVGEDSDEISIAYNYNGTTPATPANAEVNYQVTQSTAVLSLVPDAVQTYSTIVSNNSAVSTIVPYVLTNSGDATASDLTFNFAGTNPGFFHVVTGGSCTLGGILPNTGSNTCTIATQFGPAANGTAGGKAATFNVSYDSYAGAPAPSNTADVIIIGTVSPTPSATFTSSITANTFASGSGTLANPYTGNTSTNYTLSVTYTNTSPTIAATGFGTTYASLPSGWTLNPHGCNNASMAANGGTCTDIYTLNSATAGSHDLNLANVTVGWSDSSGTYPSQTVSGVGTVYTSLEAPAAANIIVQGADNSLPMGSAYAFKATITGGSSTFTPTITGLGSSIVSPASCALDDATPDTASCIFIIAPYSGIGEYSYWNPAAIDNSMDVTNPTLAYQSSGIVFTMNATNGATVFGYTTPLTLPPTGNASRAPYVYLPAVKSGDFTTAGAGITYPDEGRFTLGTQAGGGATCVNALKDSLTGLEWIQSPSETLYNWQAAQDYATTLNTCGQTDWRMPTINELRSLIDYGSMQAGNTAGQWLTAQNFEQILTAVKYWSSTPYSVGGLPQAFAVGFDEGTMSYVGTGATLLVWPVRGGEE